MDLFCPAAVGRGLRERLGAPAGARARGPALRLCGWALAVAATGCVGNIGQPGGAGSGAAGAAGDPSAAGEMPLRRLTNREYDNTVRDLLGDDTQPADQFASDRDSTFAFRRAGDVAVQDATLLRTAAESLAAAALPNLKTLLPCDPSATGEDACALQFVGTFGARAFRRPLTATETSDLVSLYTTGRTTLKLAFSDAIGLLIEGMLQSPQFLYHWEAPPNDAPVHDGAVLQLGPYQVASRLSYFIWGSMPDQALFAAAAAGDLATAAQVEAQARRLLADPKARDTLASFFADWLALDGLAARTKDATLYPAYNDAVQTAMLGETSAFVQNVVFDGDGRWSTLLGATFSFINQPLGGIYGVTVQGTDLQRTALDPTQRAGFLTQPSFLALTGSADGSNPPRRGKAVYTELLCHQLPPPPANVPAPMPASAGGTTRQRFTQHDTNACTAGCHTAMDPIGFAFENYDGIGQFRTMDNELPVDASGSLWLDGATRPFTNAIDLTNLLASSAEVRACFATQWVRYALLRTETDADQASLQSAAASFGGDQSTVRDLMVAVTTMRSFRYRSPSPGETSP
jgi:hypothetical protein